jgi:hypothetical protein
LLIYLLLQHYSASHYKGGILYVSFTKQEQSTTGPATPNANHPPQVEFQTVYTPYVSNTKKRNKDKRTMFYMRRIFLENLFPPPPKRKKHIVYHAQVETRK